MGKSIEAVKVETVKELLMLQETLEATESKLKSNKKYLEKKFGDGGGSEPMPDGAMLFTAKEPNGKESTSYAKAWEEAKQLIRDGKLHKMSKDSILNLFMEIEKRHTKPQMTSQDVVGELVDSKVTKVF